MDKKSEYKGDIFRNILQNLHTNYQPRENGEWKATPNWTEIFSWTSCPPNSIKAVMLLKNPLDAKDRHYFTSTGYGFGIRKKGYSEDIKEVATIWNFFQLLYKMHDDWTPEVKQ